MPIYKFYCADCHTVYSFLARAADTAKEPACPKCSRPKLQRRITPFAISKGRSEEGGGEEDDLPPGMDEDKMERMFADMAREAEGMDEEDPRAMARMMRKLYETTGLRLGKGMEEAMRRMEAGEDPDKIEEEMGDLLDDEDPLLAESGGSLRGLSRKLKPPAVDETLYDL